MEARTYFYRTNVYMYHNCVFYHHGPTINLVLLITTSIIHLFLDPGHYLQPTTCLGKGTARIP